MTAQFASRAGRKLRVGRIVQLVAEKREEVDRLEAGEIGAIIGMPLAVSFGRKGTIIALCAAVVVSVAYWAVGGGFQQLGNHGLLRSSVAGWSPLLIFAAAGTYFLSRVRT